MADSYSKHKKALPDLDRLEGLLEQWTDQFSAVRHLYATRSAREIEMALRGMRERLQVARLEEGQGLHSDIAPVEPLPPLRFLDNDELKLLSEALSFQIDQVQSHHEHLGAAHTEIARALIGETKPDSLRKLINKKRKRLEQVMSHDHDFSVHERLLGKRVQQLCGDEDLFSAYARLKKQLTEIKLMGEENQGKQKQIENMKAWLDANLRSRDRTPFTAPSEKSLTDAARSFSGSSDLTDSLSTLSQARRYLEDILARSGNDDIEKPT